MGSWHSAGGGSRVAVVLRARGHFRAARDSIVKYVPDRMGHPQPPPPTPLIAIYISQLDSESETKIAIRKMGYSPIDLASAYSNRRA